LSPWLRLLVAAATGAAVLIVELMAVRLMAPWFGTSQLVWTNVIGVVLAALAAGQWLGGRWAELRRGAGPAALLVAAGALSLALPELVDWLAGLVRPDGLGMDEAFSIVTWGSLLVALVTVGTPMAALGAVTPWLVRLSDDAGEHPGRVAGAVLAAGTLGSLAGAFGATHVLLPLVGSSGAVRLAGGLLVLAALPLLRVGRAGRAWAFLVLPAASALLPRAVAGPQILDSIETRYQSARVELDDDGTRLLRLNEGLDSFHSAYRPGETWTGRYFDAFVLPAVVAPPGSDGRRRALVLGLAAGTMARQAALLDPALDVEGVELDADVVALGTRWFDLPERVAVVVGDARVALAGSTTSWSAILVDCYSQQIYLPPHLASREFFELVRRRLAPGGVAALNLGGRTREDPVVEAVAHTFGTVFPGATMARIPGTRNWIVMGWNGEAPGAEVLAARLDDIGARERLEWMISADLFAPVPKVGRLLVDRDAPVEALAHSAWRRGT
jgi:spermidine synthase